MHRPQPTDAVPQFNLHDMRWNDVSFLEALLDGLSRPQKRIPSRFLYDHRGMRYSEQISRLPEYYPRRTEMRILQSHAPEIAELVGADAVFYELGCGAKPMSPVLLEKLDTPYAYVPIDVCRDALVSSSTELAASYPELRVEAVCGDYAKPGLLPDVETTGRTVAFFPGAGIGGFKQREAAQLLRQWRGRLGPSGLMIVGVDLKKDPGLIELAYNDSQGVTAAFIQNVLARANRECEANFDLDSFRYEGRYDEDEGCVHVSLVSSRDQDVRIGALDFYFARDEALQVEDAHKYELDEFSDVACAGGFSVVKAFTDPRRLFSVQILSAGC